SGRPWPRDPPPRLVGAAALLQEPSPGGGTGCGPSDVSETATDTVNVCLMNSAPGWGGGERMFLELALGFQEAGDGVTAVCRPGSELEARLATRVPLQALPCRSDWDVRTLWSLARLFRRGRYDAVFCNFGRDCVLAGVAAWPMGLPVVRVKAMEETRR